MFQVPAAVWNQIAETQQMRFPAMKALFSMDQDGITEAMNSQASALSQNGVPDSVINAYQKMGPLLAESQAISRYINQMDSLNLRDALPEVLSAAEAVAIARQEVPLSNSEEEQLLTMLTPLEPGISTAD